MFYEMLEDNEFPDQRTKIHYYLARCLQELEMYHTAQYHYMQVVKKGPNGPRTSATRCPSLVADRPGTPATTPSWPASHRRARPEPTSPGAPEEPALLLKGRVRLQQVTT